MGESNTGAAKQAKGPGREQTDDVVAILHTSDQAEAIRRMLIEHPSRKVVFVYPRPSGLWEVAVATEWGARLGPERVQEFMALIEAEFARWDEYAAEDVDDVVHDPYASFIVPPDDAAPTTLKGLN